MPDHTSRPFTIPPRSGVAFVLNAGERLTVIDPEGEQVADLLAFRGDDVAEVISSGRTLNYASRLFLTIGDLIYSNQGNCAKTQECNAAQGRRQ